MDRISFACPECGHGIKVPSTAAGRTGKCPKCETRIEVPNPEVEPELAEPEEGDTLETGTERTRRRASDIRQRRRDPQPAARNVTTSIVVAAGGALVGALAWAAVVYFTAYEVGWIAWVVGLLSGGMAVLAGGRGQTVAIAAAILAVVGICAGKVLGMTFSIVAEKTEFRQLLSSEDGRAIYDVKKRDAQGLANLANPADDQELMDYLDEYGFIGITPSEFRADHAPALRDFHARNPTFQEWIDTNVEFTYGHISAVDLAVSGLNAIDIIFAILGVTTAFGLVMKASQATAVPARTKARASARDRRGRIRDRPR